MATTADRTSGVVRRTSGTVDGIDPALLDPADRDECRLLIEAEHPGLHQALHADVDDFVLDGQVTSPRLHITVQAMQAPGHGRRTAMEPGRARSTPRQLGSAMRRCTDQQG